MIRVNIDKEVYELPTYFDIDKFVNIYKLDISNEGSWNKIISISLGVKEDLIKDADYEIKNLIISFIISMLNERTEAPLVDLEKLTFGEFVDLEVYLSLNYINYLKDVVKILSPYVKTSDKALYVVEKWLEWRNVVYKQYKGLFDLDAEKEEGDKLINNDKMKVAKTWYKVIVDLAGDDILKMEEIEMMPFRKVLNFMSYRKEQRKLMELEERKRKRKYELQKVSR